MDAPRQRERGRPQRTRNMRAIQGIRYTAVAIVEEREFEDHDRSFIARTSSGDIEVWLPNEPTFNHPDQVQGTYPSDGQEIFITLLGPTAENHKGDVGDLYLVEPVI